MLTDGTEGRAVGSVDAGGIGNDNDGVDTGMLGMAGFVAFGRATDGMLIGALETRLEGIGSETDVTDGRTVGRADCVGIGSSETDEIVAGILGTARLVAFGRAEGTFTGTLGIRLGGPGSEIDGTATLGEATGITEGKRDVGNICLGCRTGILGSVLGVDGMIDGDVKTPVPANMSTSVHNFEDLDDVRCGS
ncbi:hypothetical protein VTL71DRAFT_2376 [Oculimacula yallundae]|uniref:Uncharacterized protein n=1 Tax=Oculimacula yallundae TaxID=86028 RepID=A0ABR4C8R4_9HELO